jgi:hypothetical protein
MNWLVLITATLALSLSSCAGEIKYTPPGNIPSTDNSIIIDMGKDEIWKMIVPRLGKSFFVINNLDKESGIINVSYSGDPEKYVDCGNIHSYVMNGSGERTYDFPASKAHQVYEVMDMEKGGVLYLLDRKMNLDGRVNIIFEEISRNRCRITINTKYVVTKGTSIKRFNSHYSTSESDSISFTTNNESKFPPAGAHSGTICHPNGELEKEIISLLSGSRE